MKSIVYNLKNFKGIVTSLFVITFMFTGLKTFAADNVLQAVEIDGRNDSYNIILRSDDKAEVSKTVQAPNKMVLTLNGIRASKTINTIYNNTANVDSVVVEPQGDDSVKIFIQADNVENSVVNFDTLKTPLTASGQNNNSGKANNNIVLNDPVSTYQPVYNPAKDMQNNENKFSFSPALSQFKKAVSENKATSMMGIGMMLIFLVLCVKTIKNGDSKIKIGLSQSLKEKELENYRENTDFDGLRAINRNENVGINPLEYNRQTIQNIPPVTAGYGLKAYGARSPYTSPEITRRTLPQQSNGLKNPNFALKQAAERATLQQKNKLAGNNVASSPLKRMAPSAKKNSNIDSIKFLESMTRIYEKNGRTDLAQGLKNNMKKAKVNVKLG